MLSDCYQSPSRLFLCFLRRLERMPLLRGKPVCFRQSSIALSMCRCVCVCQRIGAHQLAGCILDHLIHRLIHCSFSVVGSMCPGARSSVLPFLQFCYCSVQDPRGPALVLPTCARQHDNVRCGCVRAERRARGRSTTKFGTWQCRIEEAVEARQAWTKSTRCGIRQIVKKNEDPVEGRRRKTKEAKERSAKTGSGGSGGDRGSANTIKYGGSDGAHGSGGHYGSCGKDGHARNGGRSRARSMRTTA